MRGTQTDRKWGGSDRQDVQGSKCFHPCVILRERDDKRTGTWPQDVTLESKLRRAPNFKH